MHSQFPLLIVDPICCDANCEAEEQDRRSSHYSIDGALPIR
jgi:hypothetical protein